MNRLTRTSLAIVVALTALVVGLSACGSSDGGDASGSTSTVAGDIRIEDPTIDYPANPSQAALRMVIHNDGDTDDVLTAASSEIAGSAMVHRSEVADDGQATMAMEEDLAVPAGAAVTFEAGGLHVMLTGITTDIEVGDTVPVTLTFKKAGDVSFDATVIEAGSEGSSSEEPHDH